jgi:hypothetical protein
LLVTGQFIAFAAIVVLVSDAFVVAVLNHAPAAMFLAGAYILSSGQIPEAAVSSGLAGLGLVVVAGLVQRLKIAVHPAYFTHNAVCHVVHGIALVLLYWSGRALAWG